MSSPAVLETALREIVEMAGKPAATRMAALTLLDGIGEIGRKAIAGIPPETAPAQMVLPIRISDKSVKLSKTMSITLEIMRTHGRLVRWPGGFWTYPNCPSKIEVSGWKKPHAVPEWYVAANTLNALADRGLAILQKVAHRYPEVAFPVES